MKAVPTSPPEFLIDQVSGGHRYRVVGTERGYLVTSRSRDSSGLILPTEWLHRTSDCAFACVTAVIASDDYMNAIGTETADAAIGKLEAALNAHTALCKQLNDPPLMGQEVRDLRLAVDPD